VQADTMTRTSALNPCAALGSVYAPVVWKIGVPIGPQLRVLTLNGAAVAAAADVRVRQLTLPPVLRLPPCKKL